MAGIGKVLSCTVTLKTTPTMRTDDDRFLKDYLKNELLSLLSSATFLLYPIVCDKWTEQ